jgi:pimeloyl-ACP methyl ester carboxylesterase
LIIRRRCTPVEKINFYGFPYGTYLGQVYSTRHPQRVRRMVLDGNVDPRKVWYQADPDQDIPFNRNIKVFFAWVAEHDDVYHLGTSAPQVEATWYRVRDELRTKPAGGKVGPASGRTCSCPPATRRSCSPARRRASPPG